MKFGKFSQFDKQRRYVTLNDAPQSVIIDAEIAVNQTVARGNNLSPWNLRIRFTSWQWNVCCCLTGQ